MQTIPTQVFLRLAAGRSLRDALALQGLNTIDYDRAVAVDPRVGARVADARNLAVARASSGAAVLAALFGDKDARAVLDTRRLEDHALPRDTTGGSAIETIRNTPALLVTMPPALRDAFEEAVVAYEQAERLAAAWLAEPAPAPSPAPEGASTAARGSPETEPRPDHGPGLASKSAPDQVGGGP